MDALTPVPRLFLALWPDGVARDALAAWRDLWQWPAGASPTRTERLHLTLHFIGGVPVDRVLVLGQALADMPATPSFTLEFGAAELWHGGIAVVCPLSVPQALAQLHAQLASVLRDLDLPVEERPFRPHVTLGRKAARSVAPGSGPAFQWRVDDGFALVQSMPGGQGYRLLHSFGS